MIVMKNKKKYTTILAICSVAIFLIICMGCYFNRSAKYPFKMLHSSDVKKVCIESGDDVFELDEDEVAEVLSALKDLKLYEIAGNQKKYGILQGDMVEGEFHVVLKNGIKIRIQPGIVYIRINGIRFRKENDSNLCFLWREKTNKEYVE